MFLPIILVTSYLLAREICFSIQHFIPYSRYTNVFFETLMEIVLDELVASLYCCLRSVLIRLGNVNTLHTADCCVRNKSPDHLSSRRYQRSSPNANDRNGYG